MDKKRLNKMEDDYASALAEVTRNVVEQIGVTQTELAERLGVSQGTVCYVLNGMRKWPLRQIILVADWMHVNPGLLLHMAEHFMATGSIDMKDLFLNVKPCEDSFVMLMRIAYGRCSDDLRNIFLTIELARKLCPVTLHMYLAGGIASGDLLKNMRIARSEERHGTEHGLSFYFYLEKIYENINSDN